MGVFQNVGHFIHGIAQSRVHAFIAHVWRAALPCCARAKSETAVAFTLPESYNSQLNTK